MTFENKEEKNNYFDTLIDLFKKHNYNSFERRISQLSIVDKKDFLVYIFVNKEIIDTDNNEIMVKLTLDNL